MYPGEGSPTGLPMSYDVTGETYRCHLCAFYTRSLQEYRQHMDGHFDQKCEFCDYTARTEGRLKRHIRDFHSEVPPDSWAGTRVQDQHLPRHQSYNDGNGSLSDNGHTSDHSQDASGDGLGGSIQPSKPRKYKCKQCNFVALCKDSFWEHQSGHIKPEKQLKCTQCKFVTEYKHHLEYHIRNHFDSKPFKCGKCNYRCVNKSMLNSHMKSHSNIYQYRCADCTYHTKYCHSLKLHLRKYEHKPATVLNLDGTPNPYPIIDVYGTRRGPRPKKKKDGQAGSSPEKQSKPLAITSSTEGITQLAPAAQTNSPPVVQQRPSSSPRQTHLQVPSPPQHHNQLHSPLPINIANLDINRGALDSSSPLGSLTSLNMNLPPNIVPPNQLAQLANLVQNVPVGLRGQMHVPSSGPAQATMIQPPQNVPMWPPANSSPIGPHQLPPRALAALAATGGNPFLAANAAAMAGMFPQGGPPNAAMGANPLLANLAMAAQQQGQQHSEMTAAALSLLMPNLMPNLVRELIMQTAMVIASSATNNGNSNNTNGNSGATVINSNLAGSPQPVGSPPPPLSLVMGLPVDTPSPTTPSGPASPLSPRPPSPLDLSNKH